jgi:hypothetical protein
MCVCVWVDCWDRPSHSREELYRELDRGLGLNGGSHLLKMHLWIMGIQ